MVPITYSHGFEHLGGNDDRLARDVALGNHHFLRKEDLAGRDFDTQITTRNHDAITLLEDIVKVTHTLFVLNLDDNLDACTVRTEDLTDLLYIFTTTNERCEHHVNAIFDTESEVCLVLFGKGRKINLCLGQVDTLARRDVAIVHSTDVDVDTVNGENKEGEDTCRK